MAVEANTVDAMKPPDMKLANEFQLEARLRALEQWFVIERFKEDIYYPNAIKTEGALGEFRGKLDSAIESLATTIRKADNAVALVNDHDTRMGVQFTAFESRIEANTRNVMEMRSQFDEIITYIRGQQEAEKDRKVILERGRWAFNLVARIGLVLAAGGGINILIEILKIVLGGK